MATTVTLKPNAIDLSGSTSGTTTLQASAVAGTTTVTLPAATDTLVGKATTDTLTNKTLTSPTMTAPVLGTPASGTVTNLTGTASININGTVGATTATTGAFTTVSASGAITYLTATNAQINAGGTTGSAWFGNSDTTAGWASYGATHATEAKKGVYYLDGVAKLTITSTGLNSTVIGATTPAAGSFTTIRSSTGSSGAIFGGGSSSNEVVTITAQAGGGGLGLGIQNSSSNLSGITFPTNASATTAYTYITVDGRSGANGFIKSYVNDAVVSNLTSTGLAVTGTLSATGAIQGAGGNAATLGYHLGTTTATFTPRITNNINNDTVIRPGASGARLTVNNFANSAENLVITDAGVVELPIGQIKFPATQNASADANTLDDYKEGTFTPTIIGTTTTGTGVYTEQTGRYTKIGNVVTFTLSLNWSAHTGTGNMQVGAMPFTAIAAHNPPVTFGYVDNIALTANNYLQGYIPASQAVIGLVQSATGGGAVTPVPVDTAGFFVCSGTYFV